MTKIKIKITFGGEGMQKVNMYFFTGAVASLFQFGKAIYIYTGFEAIFRHDAFFQHIIFCFKIRLTMA